MVFQHGTTDKIVAHDGSNDDIAADKFINLYFNEWMLDASSYAMSYVDVSINEQFHMGAQQIDKARTISSRCQLQYTYGTDDRLQEFTFTVCPHM